MKFSVTRESLLQSLQHVLGAIEKRQTLPILNNVLMESTGDTLKLTGSDLEIQLTSTAEIKGIDDGIITLPARKLHDITKLLPASSTLEISIADDRANLRSGRSRYTLTGLSAYGYPSFVNDPANLSINVPGNILKQAMDTTKHAIAMDDVRYYLNGMSFTFEDTTMRVAASDGHRLAVYTARDIIDTPFAEPRQLILPRKAVSEILRIIGDTSDAIKIDLSPNAIYLNNGTVSFAAKLTEGKFPDVNRVIPKELDRFIYVDKETFKSALSRVAVLTSDKYKAIRFKAEPDEGLNLSGHNLDQDEADETIAMEMQGRKTEMGFNAIYILDALNVCQPGQIKISVNKTENSTILEDPATPGLMHIVMPMRL